MDSMDQRHVNGKSLASMCYPEVKLQVWTSKAHGTQSTHLYACRPQPATQSCCHCFLQDRFEEKVVRPWSKAIASSLNLSYQLRRWLSVNCKFMSLAWMVMSIPHHHMWACETWSLISGVLCNWCNVPYHLKYLLILKQYLMLLLQ